MKHALVFCMICSFSPAAAMADPVVDVAIRLADSPETDLEGFMDQVTESFSESVAFDRSFGPDDVPDGHNDPLYWAVAFQTSIDGHEFRGQCNRIGRESDVLLRTDGYRGMNSSESFADLIDPQETLQGFWPDTMSAFADDAIARLDCSFRSALRVGANDAVRVLGTAFSDVRIKGDLPNLFGSGFFLIEASRGDWNSIRRLDSAVMASDDRSGLRITVTSWLLVPIR